MTNATRRSTWQSASNIAEEQTCLVNTDSIAEVVRACQAGDRDAFRQLYELCHEKILRLVVRMVGLQEAADVIQQVFLQAIRSIQKFSGKSRFETWLYRLAVNESLQHLRRKRRWTFQRLAWEPMDESSVEVTGELKELIERALARIAPELRSIFLLREIENLSYRVIAEALQIPEGTVGSRLNRARQELKRQLSELGFEGP